MIQCTVCKDEKPADAFRPEPKKRNGRRSNCRDCERAYARGWQRRTDQHTQWKRTNPEGWSRIQRRHALQRYGITAAEYELLLKQQQGRCAICGSVDPRTRTGATTWCIDHDHDTGKVRGLLCMPCNVGIGMLGDDADRMSRAAEYLSHWAAFQAAHAEEAQDG